MVSKFRIIIGGQFNYIKHRIGLLQDLIKFNMEREEELRAALIQNAIRRNKLTTELKREKEKLIVK